MLGITGRRILLSLHILLNSIWIGGLAAILLLNFVKSGASNGDQLYAIHLAQFKIHDYVVMNIGFGVIVTGLLFSLFTKWAFFDFYWVTFKWVGLVLLFFVITFYLAPAISGMAAISDTERSQALTNPAYLQYEKEGYIFAWLLMAILLAVIVISVFRPWGPRKKPFKVGPKMVLVLGGGLGLGVIVGVLLQFLQLQSYRNMPVRNIDLATISDGNYTGEAKYGFNYIVEVAIKNRQIDRITIVENYSNSYARLAEGVVKKVIDAQSLNVDAVTGATTTSRCLMKAIENAIAKGRLQ